MVILAVTCNTIHITDRTGSYCSYILLVMLTLSHTHCDCPRSHVTCQSQFRPRQWWMLPSCSNHIVAEYFPEVDVLSMNW